MEFLPVIEAIALIVITIVAVVVAVYLVQVLQRIKATLDRVNMTIDLVEEKVVSVTAPLQSLSVMAANLGSGIQVFESFVSRMTQGKKERK
jgi:uncharacterized protein YoxC